MSPGYLVIIDDNDGVLKTNETSGVLDANAFLVNLNDSDAVFLPVIPLERTDLANSDIDLLHFPPNALLSLVNGHNDLFSVYVRFLTGPGGDPRTLLVTFTPGDGPSLFSAAAVSPTGLTLEGLQIPTAARRLNVIDVESIQGLAFNEGYIIPLSPMSVSPELPGYAPTRFGFVFGLTRASIVGAEQTIMGFGAK